MIDNDFYTAMGLEFTEIDGINALVLPFTHDMAGREGFIHGGAIGELLEAACQLAFEQVSGTADADTRPVNIAIEYLRGARQEPLYAIGRVVRRGRRISHIEAEAWQSDRSSIIAQARMHFFQ